MNKNSPNYSGRDEEDDGSKKEGEALHKVQCGWVKGVEDAATHQETQALHTGNTGKQGTWEKAQTHNYNMYTNPQDTRCPS